MSFLKQNERKICHDCKKLSLKEIKAPKIIPKRIFKHRGGDRIRKENLNHMLSKNCCSKELMNKKNLRRTTMEKVISLKNEKSSNI